MAVEDALVRPRVAQHRAVEVAELGVDRRQRGDRVPLAEDEQVLPAPRRIDDVDVDESAVVQRHERDGGGERAAGVQALVDGVAALLEAQQPDVGVLDRQQLEDALAQADSRDRRPAAPPSGARWSNPARGFMDAVSRRPPCRCWPPPSALLPRARRRGSIRPALRCGGGSPPRPARGSRERSASSSATWRSVISVQRAMRDGVRHAGRDRQPHRLPDVLEHAVAGGLDDDVMERRVGVGLRVGPLARPLRASCR